MCARQELISCMRRTSGTDIRSVNIIDLQNRQLVLEMISTIFKSLWLTFTQGLHRHLWPTFPQASLQFHAFLRQEDQPFTRSVHSLGRVQVSADVAVRGGTDMRQGQGSRLGCAGRASECGGGIQAYGHV